MGRYKITGARRAVAAQKTRRRAAARARQAMQAMQAARTARGTRKEGRK